MLQIAAHVELGLCWVAWSMAFVKPSKQAASQKEAASALAWSYVRPVGFQKSTASLIVSMILGPPSVALGWAAARHLGKQWRYKAALSQDHELIQTGPYRWLRHPIYASMLGMLVATLAACTWWPMAIGSVITFLAGTEIRVRAEERLLAERFQDSYGAYCSRTSAFIPFIR